MVPKEDEDYTRLVTSTSANSISLYCKRLSVKGISYKTVGNSLHVKVKDFDKARGLLKSV
jgi:hypothetical protein